MAKKEKYRTTFSFDGKRYDITANSKDELLKKKYNRLRDLEEGKITICSTMPLSKWTEQCLTIYKVNVAEETLAGTRYRLNKHLLESLGHMPLKSIKPAHLQKIINENDGMSFSHIKKLMQEINFIFDRAVDNDLINSNPAAKLVTPQYYKGTRRALSEVESRHFLQVCDVDDGFRLFELMYYCGCRPGEAIKCIGKDIEMVNHVPQLHIRGTKTVNSDRYVPIPDVLFAKVKNTQPFAPIAPNRSGKTHSESSYDRATEHLKRNMNISMGCKLYRNQLIPPFPLAGDFVPYCLRHTYCTNLAKSGVDIRTAQKLMGHSSIQITADIYTHVDQSQIIAAAKQINDFFTLAN